MTWPECSTCSPIRLASLGAFPLATHYCPFLGQAFVYQSGPLVPPVYITLLTLFGDVRQQENYLPRGHVPSQSGCVQTQVNEKTWRLRLHMPNRDNLKDHLSLSVPTHTRKAGLLFRYLESSLSAHPTFNFPLKYHPKIIYPITHSCTLLHLQICDPGTQSTSGKLEAILPVT